MLQLAPQGQKKYVIVTIGTIILKDNDVCIKCALCGGICHGITQQDQVEKLFECLSTHMPAQYIFEVYEQRDNKIITSINREAWDKAKRSTKYKR